MKKYYILLFAAIASFAGTAQKVVPSQLSGAQQRDLSSLALPELSTPEKVTGQTLLKSTICQDTSFYPAFKASASPTAYWTIVNDDWNGFSQTYLNTNNLEIVGFYHLTLTDFNTTSGDVPDVPVTFEIHSTGNWYANDPLAIIASESGIVTDNGGDWQTHIFATPVPVTGDFAISLTLDASAPLTDTLYPISNVDGDGANEDLSCLYFPSDWYSLVNDIGADHDFYILPIVRQTVTAGFSLSDSCLAVNQVTTITDTSSIQLATENMFNLAAWWGGENDAWVMGEGTVGDTIYGNPGTFSYANPGTYTITLHDTLWLMNQDTYCAESYTQTVSVGLAASTTIVNALCNGDDGSVTLTGAGGDGTYTYSDDDITYTGTGSYTVAAGTATYYVQDGVGCVSSTSGTVTEPAVLTISVDTENDPSGCTLTDGSILISVAGGTSTYFYDWDNDGTGDNDDVEDLATIGAGTYNVIVIDANGCTANNSGTLADPNSPSIVVDLTTDLTCYGDNTGAIATTISGGTGTLVIDWDNDGTGDNDDLDDISGLGAGTYNLTVVDVSNCSNAAVVTLTQPDSLELTITYVAIGCNGDSTDIDVEVVGGVATYTYDWDNDGYDDTQDSTGNIAGTYTVMVMDASGCLIDSTFTIVEPAALALSVTGTDEMMGNDGIVDLTVAGGTPAYGYSWDNSASTEDLSGLVAGTYMVTVTDANACSDTISITIDSQVGIAENGISAVVYPNPTNGIVTVEFSQILDGTITMYDGIGQLISSQNITNVLQSIDLSGNAKGIYFLHIVNGNSKTVVKILLD